MAEGIVVGVIVLTAAAFVVYRFFVRPQCGCGSAPACCHNTSACSSAENDGQKGGCVSEK